MTETDARLRWRCRRGMRELDRLLAWYLDARYARGTDAEQAAFAVLLEQQDPQLWDWLIGRGEPADPQMRRIVDEIRAGDHA